MKKTYRHTMLHLRGRKRELQKLIQISALSHGIKIEVPYPLQKTTAQSESTSTTTNCSTGFLSNKLKKAGLSLPASVFILCCIAFGLLLSLLTTAYIKLFFLPVVFTVGFLMPFAYIDKLSSNRSKSFAADYPCVLLATASSVKVGLTPYQALKRSIQILPNTSPVRTDIEKLLSNLDLGMTRENAIRQFAIGFELPELDLFRSALLLSLEHGGQFAPTLQRLALVSRDRLSLIHQAQVNTSTMRMTANIILGLVPFVLITLSSRTPDYWQTLQQNALANTTATIGAIVLGVNYYALRRMSNFKP